MPDIIPRTNSGISVPNGFTRAEGRDLIRAQNKEIAYGQIKAVRVQAAGFVAAVGVQAVGLVSREAAFQADGDPAITNRVNHIIDQLAVFVGNEVSRFGMDRYRL
ncbi:Uncharacterised protein [Mycobacteroides abscessus subsp. abscessus]|uniref:hypothetical protein n=1 Tax=Mycobacteroides abscessus TaxID=36809 RepID=UPI000925EE46|nr:hypothetical protein [Mycobacteroides abscessus]SHQ95906.1 Uncharacterised protein [Mycobacteroides abscessus subsp. abscessus]